MLHDVAPNVAAIVGRFSMDIEKLKMENAQLDGRIASLNATLKLKDSFISQLVAALDNLTVDKLGKLSKGNHILDDCRQECRRLYKKNKEMSTICVNYRQREKQHTKKYRVLENEFSTILSEKHELETKLREIAAHFNLKIIPVTRCSVIPSPTVHNAEELAKMEGTLDMVLNDGY